MSLENIAKKRKGELVEILENMDVQQRISMLFKLGESGNTEAYEVLRKEAQGDLRHQALIAMAEVSYSATMDIVVSLLKKEREDASRKKNKNIVGYIFCERIDRYGHDEFYKDLEALRPLDPSVKNVMYSALEEVLKLKLTDVELTEDEREPYLAKAREILGI